MVLLTILVAATVGMAEPPQWKVGRPAPDLPAGHRGRIAVFIGPNELPSELRDGARRLRDRNIQIHAGAGEQCCAYLVDEQGIVRRREQLPRASGTLLAMVSQWENGRASFKSRCARCHGEDGRDTGYPLIRSREGIGERYNREQIREKLRPTPGGSSHFFVRGEPFTPADLEDLVVFLASL